MYSEANFYNRSDVINGILKCVECRVDLFPIKSDKAQSVWRKSEVLPLPANSISVGSSAAEMIGHADDLNLLINTVQKVDELRRDSSGGSPSAMSRTQAWPWFLQTQIVDGGDRLLFQRLPL